MRPLLAFIPLFLLACTPAVSTIADSGTTLLDGGTSTDAGETDGGVQHDAGPVDAGCMPIACTTGVSCDDMDDGCGGTLHCGACAGDLLCGGAGTPNVCSVCEAPVLAETPPWGYIGSEYSTNLNVRGYGINRYSIVSGALPRNLTLSEFGAIYGQPHEHGRFDVVVEVGDQCPTPHAERLGFTLIIAIPGEGANSVANGLFHSLAATYSGTLLAWGNNQDLTLGSDVTDPTMARYQPDWVLDSQNHPITTAAAVAATDRASFALLWDGHVLSWGKNDYGVLGDGSTTSRGRAGQVLGAGAQPLADIAALAAGQEHVLAKTATGTVLAWGRGDYGRLGDGSTTEQHSAQPVLTSGGMPLENVTAIAATATASAALLTNHHVMTWGRDSHQHLYPTALTWPGGGEIDNATAIAGGSSHFLALTSEGKVIAWGNNEQGELGNGQTLQYDQDPAYVMLSEGVVLTGVSGIAAGDRFSLAIVNGAVMGWGKNNIGSLGDGTYVLSRTYPVHTLNYFGNNLVNATGLVASRSTSWAFMGGQQLFGWGDNSLGKLAMPWGFTTARSYADYVVLARPTE